jgi:hypothetical protein
MQPTVTLSAEDFATLRRPLVYVLRAADGAALYVGLGSRGATRPLDPKHHAIGDVAAGETLELYCFDTAEEALDAEIRMIQELHPVRNGQHRRTPEQEAARVRSLREAMRNRPARPSRKGSHFRRKGDAIGITPTAIGGWRAFVRVNGRLHSKSFKPGTGMLVMRRWREETRVLFTPRPDYSAAA